jgi:hypothetical protein
MAWTAEQLAQLDKAMATGARSISFEGKSTTFRSLAEMRTLRAEMAAEIAGTERESVAVTSFSKGLDS